MLRQFQNRLGGQSGKDKATTEELKEHIKRMELMHEMETLNVRG